jgi:hypothetical protein
LLESCNKELKLDIVWIAEADVLFVQPERWLDLYPSGVHTSGMQALHQPFEFS